MSRKKQTTTDIQKHLANESNEQIMDTRLSTPDDVHEKMFFERVKRCYADFAEIKEPTNIYSAGNSAIINKVFKNAKIQAILLDIFSGCQKPTFIPVSTMMTGSSVGDHGTRLDAEATIVSNAIQILLFATKG